MCPHFSISLCFRDTFDIVDLGNASYYNWESDPYCDSLHEYPLKASRGAGEYGHGKIIHCGGYVNTYEGEDYLSFATPNCYYYSPDEVEDKWVNFGNLTEAKYLLGKRKRTFRFLQICPYFSRASSAQSCVLYFIFP